MPESESKERLDMISNDNSFHLCYTCNNVTSNLKKGDPIYITVGDGGSIPGYTHNIEVGIGEERFYAEIGFFKRLGIGLNILGRTDIFDVFDVCFSDKKKEIRFLMEE